MAIDLQKLEQKFNALLDDPNFVTEFEQWLEARSVSQNSGKPIVLSSRESIVNECRDELLKHLFKVFHTNGYPIEAVPKATVLSLPQLMRCSSRPIA